MKARRGGGGGATPAGSTPVEPGRVAAELPGEAVVLEVRAMARELGVRKRRLERLLERVRALRVAPANGQGATGLALALPHMERVLERTLLELDDAWNDLGIGFSTRDLARAIRNAQGLRQRPAPPPKREKSSRTRPGGKRGGSRSRPGAGGRKRRRDAR